MADLNLTDTQRREFADALGVDEADLTDTELLAALKAKAAPAPAADTDQAREFEQRLTATETEAAAAKDRAEKLERELHETKRTAFVTEVLAAGKATPAQTETIERMYDLDADMAHKHYAEQPADETLVREYGSGDDQDERTPEEQTAAADRDYAASSAGRFGFTTEELI